MSQAPLPLHFPQGQPHEQQQQQQTLQQAQQQQTHASQDNFPLHDVADLFFDKDFRLQHSTSSMLDESLAALAWTDSEGFSAPVVSCAPGKASASPAKHPAAPIDGTFFPKAGDSLPANTSARAESQLSDRFCGTMPADGAAATFHPATSASGGSCFAIRHHRAADGMTASGGVAISSQQEQQPPPPPLYAAGESTAAAADVEQWLLQRALEGGGGTPCAMVSASRNRAIEENSSRTTHSAAGLAAAAPPGLHIPLDLLQQSADAALFAQLQMLSSPVETAGDFHDSLVTRPVVFAHPAPPRGSSATQPVSVPIDGARQFSATDAESPRLSTARPSAGNFLPGRSLGQMGGNECRYMEGIEDTDHISRLIRGGTGSNGPSLDARTATDRNTAPSAQAQAQSSLLGAGASAAADSPRRPHSPSAVFPDGSFPAVPQCASSKLALEMLHKLRSCGGAPGPLLPDFPTMLDINNGVAFAALENGLVKTEAASAAAAAEAAAVVPGPSAGGYLSSSPHNSGAALPVSAKRVALTAPAQTPPASPHASFPLALAGVAGADASGALLVRSRPSRSGAGPASTLSGEMPGGAITGKTEGGGVADGSTQWGGSGRAGVMMGAGGAAVQAGVPTGASAATAAPAAPAAPRFQGAPDGRDAGAPSTSAAASGGGAGLSGGFSADDDWRPRSRTRFDAEAMKRGEIKPRSMKERRRRDKISEGLRQLRQAIPETLLGSQQDMAAMIEAAVMHISNLQAKVSKLEGGTVQNK